MSVLTFLVELAHIPPYKPAVKPLLNTQPQILQKAFVSNQTTLIKQLLYPTCTINNERTVVII